MALIKCPECGRDNVSSQAESCPNCGYPISETFNVTYQKTITPLTQESSELADRKNVNSNTKLTWDQKYNNNSKKNPNTKIPVVIIIGIVIILGMIFYYQGTRCIVPGCDNKRMSSSEYCVKHYFKAKKNSNSWGDYYDYSSYSTSTVQTGTEGALNKAKSYLNSSAFSYTGLIDQLEYEGFTESEAKYGVDNCGADWYEQAIKKAKSYRKSSYLSGNDLVEQLIYEGFTSDQAEYGTNNSF